MKNKLHLIDKDKYIFSRDGNLNNEEIAKRYLEWFSLNYKTLKNKYRRFCKEKDYDWNEDIFSDTYLKIYESISKKGLIDTSNQGFDNYTFRSFKQNLQREKQYCRVSKRDMNYNSDNINDIYEIWYNENNSPARVKLLNDLYKDFATLYILTKVEDNFDSEHFLLFRLKYLIPNMTYKKLQEKTQAKKCRQKVIEVRDWVRQNISKDDIKKVFNKMYSDLI